MNKSSSSNVCMYGVKLIGDDKRNTGLLPREHLVSRTYVLSKNNDSTRTMTV